MPQIPCFHVEFGPFFFLNQWTSCIKCVHWLMLTASICWNVCWAPQHIINSSFTDHWSVNSTGWRPFVCSCRRSTTRGSHFHEKSALPRGPEAQRAQPTDDTLQNQSLFQRKHCFRSITNVLDMTVEKKRWIEIWKFPQGSSFFWGGPPLETWLYLRPFSGHATAPLWFCSNLNDVLQPVPIFTSERSKPVRKEKVRVRGRTSRHLLKLGITSQSSQISVKAAMLTNAGKSV